MPKYAIRLDTERGAKWPGYMTGTLNGFVEDISDATHFPTLRAASRALNDHSAILAPLEIVLVPRKILYATSRGMIECL